MARRGMWRSAQRWIAGSCSLAAVGLVVKPPSEWNTNDVSSWLGDKGLDQYAARFRAENVDGEILLECVTEETARNDLGVSKLHVKRLIREVGKLKGGSGVSWDDIPRIDMRSFLDGSDKQGVAKAWDRAMSTSGFLIIENHTIPTGCADAVFEAGKRFFAKPQDEKNKWHSDSYGESWEQSYGYTSVGGEGFSGAPDMVESIMFNKDGLPDRQNASRAINGSAGHTPWPCCLAKALKVYGSEVDDLLRRLMEVAAVSLGLSEDYFVGPYANRRCSLRLSHYPPITGQLKEGQVRYTSHTDDIGLTILRTDGSPGLEVLVDGVWKAVPYIPGGLIVNVADVMAQWTNGRWVSNYHRVANPVGKNAKDSRYSLLYFTGPDARTTIEALPGTSSAMYKPMSVEEIAAHHAAKTEKKLAKSSGNAGACPKGHDLEIGAAGGKGSCDGSCGKNISFGDIVFGCKQCNWLMCEDCQKN